MASDFGSRQFLREWREFRELSLEEVAERVKLLGAEPRFQRPEVRPKTMTHATLSRVERGLIPYDQVLLEILAETYGTDPASLIMRDPSDPEGVWSVYDRIPRERRAQALAVLQTFVEAA